MQDLGHMWTWREFETAQPAHAREIREWMVKTGHAYCATIDGRGRPRIAPVSPHVVGRDLVLSVLPGSPKAHDLRERQWCYLHLPLTRTGTEYAILGRVCEPLGPTADALRSRLVDETTGINDPSDLLLILYVAKVVVVTYEQGSGGDLVRDCTVWRP